MNTNHYLAGVGRALLFRGNRLMGVGKTFTQSTFSFSATPEEIRAGEGNALQGRFFHDSGLTINIIDAMFNLEYVAMKLGVDIQQGGITLYESGNEGEMTANNAITLAHTPVAFDGALIGWYKKPEDAEWTVGNITEQSMAIPGGGDGKRYCVKYFYQNEDVRSIDIPAQFNPTELHVVLIHDEYQAGSFDSADMRNSSKIGRLITDIPRVQLDPNLELSLTPTSSAPVDITGTALVAFGGNGCAEEGTYGTMTEELFGASWKDNVTAIAPENGDIELVGREATEDIIMRAVYANMNAQRKDNKNFTFAVDSGASAQVGAHDGKVTAQADGDTYISVALTDKPNVPVAYVKVTVSGIG